MPPRGREIGTRLALGASRGRIGRQLLADGLLLSLAGGTLGVALHANISPSPVAFAFLSSVVSGFLSSLAPTLHVGREDLISSLRERGGASLGGIRFRKCIVTLQVAFSLIFVLGAAVFIRSLSGLLAKGPGFDTSNLVSFSLDPERNAYSQDQARQLIRRVHAGPRRCG